MRIAYVGRWTPDASDGVRAKAEGHAAEWRRAGHEVQLFRLAPSGYERSPRRSGALGSVVDTLRMRRALRRYAPDVIYARYGLFVPSLAALQRRFPTFVEINGRDRVEAAARGRRWLNALARRSLLGHAAGLLCVSQELAQDVAEHGKPTQVIANGTPLDVEPVASTPAARPLLAFLLGVPMPRHGLDKLLLLARALPDCDFAVIGADLPADAPTNVRAHPAMARAAYAAILARADAGIGPLAMHRAGVSEGSPLKVREYLAHGLPVIIAHEDTDLRDDDWFVLRLPNREDNVAVDEVRAFLQRVRGRRVAREEIAERVGAAAKERARLAFMAQVAGR
jgi:glycosyltransferase involved in cell wall biosynthesis